MLDHPGGQNHITRLCDRFIDLDGLVLWQIEDLIPVKQTIIHHPVYPRKVRQPRKKESFREETFNQMDKPARTAHPANTYLLLFPGLAVLHYTFFHEAFSLYCLVKF
jgi:hypothetical protein